MENNIHALLTCCVAYARNNENGDLIGFIETNINQDRSGKTVPEDLSQRKSHYPVTILTWDENGVHTLLKICKIKEGRNCIAATAS